MCRLLLASKKSITLYNKKYGFLKLLNHLEKQMGGHGNGFCLMKDGRITIHMKGVNLSNKEIYNAQKHEDYDWMIYHTRLVSVGEKTDAQCHPYVEGNDALAMNGTEHDFKDMANALDTSDSDMVFRALRGAGTLDAAKALASLDSVFVGFFDGKPIASGGWGSLEQWGKSFFASSFPKHVKSKAASGILWIDGEEIWVPSYGGGHGYGGYGERWDDRSYWYSGGRTTKPIGFYSGNMRGGKSKMPSPSYGGYEYDMGYEDGNNDGIADGYEEGYGQGWFDKENGLEYVSSKKKQKEISEAIVRESLQNPDPDWSDAWEGRPAIPPKSQEEKIPPLDKAA